MTILTAKMPKDGERKLEERTICWRRQNGSVRDAMTKFEKKETINASTATATAGRLTIVRQAVERMGAGLASGRS
jgi:hypothetical protein